MIIFPHLWQRRKTSEFIYRILWFNIVKYKLRDCVLDVIDVINENEGIEWMEQLIMEYCVGFKSKSNDIDSLYTVIYDKHKFLFDRTNTIWFDVEKEKIQDVLGTEISHDNLFVED